MTVPVRAGGGARVSARPERLTSLAETTVAIREALAERAGYLADACDAYDTTNGLAWRADVDDLPGALTAWADSLAALGEWAAQVGAAFLEADAHDAGGVHRLTSDHFRYLLPADARAELDGGRAGHHREYRDWGDADDPPPWLTALRATAIGVGRAGDGADAVRVVEAGRDGAWRPSTSRLLGRFATVENTARFGRVLGVADVGLSGFTAGLEQWLGDERSLEYTRREMVTRTVARTAAEGTATMGTGAAGVGVASTVCPGLGVVAPLCAVTVVGGMAVAGEVVTSRVVDRVIPGPKPADHDPAIVRDEVLGPRPEPIRRDGGTVPGYLPKHVPDETWDVAQVMCDEGRAAAGRARR